jgi:hypothetical protein
MVFRLYSEAPVRAALLYFLNSPKIERALFLSGTGEGAERREIQAMSRGVHHGYLPPAIR